jgi:hypothetical protein
MALMAYHAKGDPPSGRAFTSPFTRAQARQDSVKIPKTFS